MKKILTATAVLAGLVAFAPAASAAIDPPDNCPQGDMCVYSDGGFSGNEIWSPPSIPIDIPANFGGVKSFYNYSSVRWCAHFTTGGVYQIDPETGVGRAFYDIISVAADGSC